MNLDKKPMIFESHAHYDSEQFNEDREELLNSMQENGVGTIINSGASWDSVTEVVELAEKYPFVYAAVGLHPDEVGDLNEERFAFMKEQCRHEKVVAVGEIGLDYYWDNESHDVQKNGLSDNWSLPGNWICLSLFTAGMQQQIRLKL